MNLVINEIAPQLAEAVNTGYRGGLASIVRLNKKKILKLSDAKRSNFTEPLFKISYTGIDQRILKNFEIEAFTVAGVLQYECEEKLKAMAKSLLDGSHPSLQKNPAQDIKKIWIHEAYNILSPYVEVPDAPQPSILVTNLRTATVSAYHAAEWQRLQQLKDVYPAYQYKTVGDNRVREEHAALADKVFSGDDPFWNTHYPPNGWNCRCYVNPISSDELAEIPSEHRVQLTDTETRNALMNATPVQKEFKRNSGKAESIWGKWLETKFKDFDYNKKFKEVFDYSRSVGRYQEKDLLNSVLDKHKTDFVSKELTRKAWEKEFPNDAVDTPLGRATLSGGKQWQSQFEKMLAKEDERYKFFGLMKPTLSDPTIVIKDARGGLVFVKKFAGKSEIVFFSAGFRNGELITILTNSPRRFEELLKKLEKGEVLVLKDSTLRGSDEPTRHSAAHSVGFLKFDNNVRSDSETVNEQWGEFIAL